MPRISTCTDTITDDTNVPTKDDKYPWLNPDNKRRLMTDAEILRLKLSLDNFLLDEKGKEEFLTKTDDFHDVFDKVWMYEEMMMNDDNLESNLLTSSLLKICSLYKFCRVLLQVAHFELEICVVS